MVDGSAVVRQTSHILINTVMGLISTDAIGPFFQVLMAHLKCGLTHIQERIQLDTLKVLESCIQYYPSLFAKHAGNILPVVVGLLSRQRSIPSPSKASSKRGMGLIGIIQKAIGSNALASDPGSNLVKKASRMRIFCVISTILDCLLMELPHKSLDLVNVDLLQDREKFLHLMDTLVSILLESWVECHPTTVISAEMSLVRSLTFMESIINVLSVLLKLVLKFSENCDGFKSETKNESDMMVLCRNFSKDIAMHVMCHFPFVAATGLEQGKLHQLQYTLNLSICQVVVILHKLLIRVDVISDSTLAAMHYLGNLDTKDIRSILYSTQTALVCSNTITDSTPVICEMSRLESVQKDVMVKVFAFMRNFYEACHPCSRSKQSLVKCFSGIYINELQDHDCR